MAYYLNQGNEKFKDDVSRLLYVDKSMLIKECNLCIKDYNNPKFMCITRPRRFGKSMAISMLNAYYSKGCDSKELFSKLKISKDSTFEKHLNKHNVIWIDIAELYSKLEDESTFVKELKKRITKELDECFPGVLTEDELDVSDLLYKIYVRKNERFIFLIDEWDVVFRESNDENLKNEYMRLLRTLFKGSNTSTCIDLVYMTGILPIKRYNNKESALNNFKEYTMLDSYPISEYIGFTASEVEELCKEYNMDYNQMKKWYDGYNLDGIELYNPKSVVEAITSKKFRDYWTSTSALETATNYLRLEEESLKDKLISMLADDSVSVSVRRFDNDISKITSADDVLTLLIHLGYLTYNYDLKECYIPNYEIKCELEIALEDLNWYDLYEPINDSKKAVEALYNSKEEVISKILDKNHELYASCLNKNNEQVLELLTIFSFNTLRSTHNMYKEPQNIKGRADIIYIPRYNDPAIIVELKYNKTESVAITQIKEKGYLSLLEGYKGKVILCGINYDDNMNHKTLIEEIEI